MNILKPVFRVVTGHDKDGCAIISHEGVPPSVIELMAVPGTIFHEIWNTPVTPAPVDNGADPTVGPLILSPPDGGTRIRVVDMPPDTEILLKNGAAEMRQAFSQLGEVAASTVSNHSPHPLMHRTESVDYGIVLEGEIVLVLDKSETTLPQGSIVVQRGINHAWANRSGRMARMVFILVSGQYAPEVKTSLSRILGK